MNEQMLCFQGFLGLGDFFFGMVGLFLFEIMG
jgi:hypothetical protein